MKERTFFKKPLKQWKKQSLSKKFFLCFLAGIILIWLYFSINNFVDARSYADAKGFDYACTGWDMTPRECTLLESISNSFVFYHLIMFLLGLLIGFYELTLLNISLLLFFWSILISLIASIITCNRIKSLFKRKKSKE